MRTEDDPCGPDCRCKQQDVVEITEGKSKAWLICLVIALAIFWKLLF